MKHRPEDLFRAEKERAQGSRNSQHARLLAEAKAAFDKLMAEGQAARKSGRPRKHPLPPLKTSSSTRPPVRPPAPAPPPKPVAATPAPVKATPAKPTSTPRTPAPKPAKKAGAKPVAKKTGTRPRAATKAKKSSKR